MGLGAFLAINGGNVANGELRLLLVEDNDHDAEIVARMLRNHHSQQFELLRVRSASECESALQTLGTFHVLLLDHSLPGEDGLSFLRRSRDQDALPPVILLTGWGDARIAAEAIQAGAYDYLPKSALTSDVLAEAIARALQRHRSELRDRMVREELEWLAVRDELTGLYNRRYLDRAFEHECLRVRKYERDLSCLIMDLDNFKSCNDTYGHLTGDLALKHVAATIKSATRGADIVARYGGEEFVVIMPETRCDEASAAAERIRSSVEATPLVEATSLAIPPGPILVTVSIGVCAFADEHGGDPPSILGCADTFLRLAKQTGKNAVCGHGMEVAAVKSRTPTSPPIGGA